MGHMCARVGVGQGLGGRRGEQKQMCVKMSQMEVTDGKNYVEEIFGTGNLLVDFGYFSK